MKTILLMILTMMATSQSLARGNDKGGDIGSAANECPTISGDYIHSSGESSVSVQKIGTTFNFAFLGKTSSEGTQVNDQLVCVADGKTHYGQKAVCKKGKLTVSIKTGGVFLEMYSVFLENKKLVIEGLDEKNYYSKYSE